MGTVRKINDEYFIEFFARGLKYQQKAGRDKLEAQKALKEIEAQIAKGEAAIIVRDVDLDIFFYDFLESLALDRFHKTISRYQSAVTHFQQYLRLEHANLRRLSEITPRIIEEYKLYLSKSFPPENSISPHVVNLTLILLRDALQYAIKLGYLSDNPVLHIRFVSGSRSSSKVLSVLTDEEILSVLTSAPKDFKPVIEFMFLTGLRSWELIDLKWSQVDWGNRCLNLPLSTREKLKARNIPLHLRAQEILQQWEKKAHRSSFIFSDLAGQKWKKADIEKKLRDIFIKCPLKKGLDFTALRHSFAVSLIRKGVPFSKLYGILGKTDIARMMIYFSHLQSANLDG